MLKVLVVDDTRTVRLHLSSVLRSAGYEVVEAEDGQEALAAACEAQPDVILLDVEMPRLDGIACCRQLKSDPATKDIKVVMVTTRDDLSKVREAFKAGCDGYLNKPVETEALLRKVKALAQLRGARHKAQAVLHSRLHPVAS